MVCIFEKLVKSLSVNSDLRLSGIDQPQTPKQSFFKLRRSSASFPIAEHIFLQLNWPCMEFLALLGPKHKSRQQDDSSKPGKEKKKNYKEYTLVTVRCKAMQNITGKEAEESR